MGILKTLGSWLSHRLQEVEIHPICPVVPVVTLVVGSTANIEMRRVNTAAVVATVTNDLFEARGDVVQGTVDEAVSCILLAFEPNFSDRIGRGFNTACLGGDTCRNEGEGALLGLLLVVGMDVFPAFL